MSALKSFRNSARRSHQSPVSRVLLFNHRVELPWSALITLSKVHCRAFATPLETDEDLPAVTEGFNKDRWSSSAHFSRKKAENIYLLWESTFMWVLDVHLKDLFLDLVIFKIAL